MKIKYILLSVCLFVFIIVSFSKVLFAEKIEYSSMDNYHNSKEKKQRPTFKLFQNLQVENEKKFD